MKKTLQKISLGIVCFLGLSYQTIAQQPIADFKFNSSTTSEAGGLTFSTANTSFVQGRDGATNGAISMANQSTSVTISNLPVGTSARTVSIWVKLNSFNTDDYNQFFSYGSTVGGSTSKWYAGGMNATNVMAVGYANNTFFPTTNTLNTWNHFVFVYNGTSSTVYKNGVSLGTKAHALNTNASTTFNLGLGVSGEKGFNGAIDDLKIYNSALNQTQVTSLFNNNSVTVQKLEILSIDAKAISLTSFSVDATIKTLSQTNSGIQVSTSSNFASVLKTGMANTLGGNVTQNTRGNIDGLTSGATYFYRMISTDLDNRSDTSEIKSITLPLTNPNAPTDIAEFDFDNSYLDKTGQLNFSNASGTTFTEDRFMNPSKAIHLTNSSISSVIPNLPANGWDRTISYWLKRDSILKPDVSLTTFDYGNRTVSAGYLSQEFYNSQNKNYLLTGAYIYDINIEVAFDATKWNHFVVTYSKDTLKIYQNGVKIAAEKRILNTIVDAQNNQFIIGGTNTNAAFDDLKIYNYALTQSQISNLYRGNVITGAESTYASQTAFYPNPAKDVVHVSGFSEILTLSGNKVAEGTETIDVSGLSSGIYIVKTGANTSKLIKE